MASLLRQIVAGPRARHEESNLDLCYVTDNIIATSGPGASYPEAAYRNPLKDLVKFLDSKHKDNWAIWEFRAEGTGYGDDDVYGRIRHYPWPDHHPPPFALVPLIMGSMRNWLYEKAGRVVVVHCKAGKGRSGTIACSYLISEEGWTPEDAMARFTERRMRPGFGAGISIPSQRRTISYVDRWVKGAKKYVERPVEVLELHVWGLRDGVKLAVEGYVEEGKVIKTFHTFKSSEREIVRGAIKKDTGFADVALEVMGKKKTMKANEKAQDEVDGATEKEKKADISRNDSDFLREGGGDVIFRPSSRVVLPSSDINIDAERRNRSKYGGFTMVTSVAHVWFNTYFEGRGPEQGGKADDSGVFEIEWDAMDGIKGSSRKGTRAFDRIAVLWKAVDVENKAGIVINEPAEGEEVKQMRSASTWQSDEQSQDFEKKLGLRASDAESAAISRASSMREKSHTASDESDVPDEIEGTKPYTESSRSNAQLGGDSTADHESTSTNSAPIRSTTQSANNTKSNDSVAGTVAGVKNLSTADLPDGKPESELDDRHHTNIGTLHLRKDKDAAT